MPITVDSGATPDSPDAATSATAPRHRAAGARAQELEVRSAGPVIVACDGTPSSEQLFTAARECAAALGSRVEVLGACEPTPMMPVVGGGVHAAPELDAVRSQMMLVDVNRALSLASSADPEWRVDVKLGAPPELLATEAERRGAALIVMGIGRHNPLDRLLGSEITLATLRRTRVPLLAVGASFGALPRHAVVGMDFSPASVRAAMLAARLLGPGGRLVLVHARPTFDHPSADWRAWDLEYGRTMSQRFAETVAQLDDASGTVPETVSIRGEPAPTLLAYAQQVGADLIAMGSQRHGLLDRLLVGSVASRVLRITRTAVLIAPAPLVAGAAGLAPEGARVESSEDPGAWSAMLDVFSRINLGRPALLEAGAEAHTLRPVLSDCVFGGITADGPSRRIRIVLMPERQQDLGQHAHEESAVMRVAIVRDAAGRDLGLRLRHARGVTRLSFQ